MTIQEFLKKYKMNLIICIGFLLLGACLVMAKYNIEFSTTYAKVIALVLIIFMLTTFKEYWIIIIVLIITVLIHYKEDLKEGFNDILKAQLDGAKKSLEIANKRIGKLEESEKQYREKYEDVRDENDRNNRDKLALGRELKQSELAKESLSEENNGDSCTRAKEVLDEPTKYTSRVQRKATKTMEKCMESFSNLAGFGISNNLFTSNERKEDDTHLRSLVENFKSLNSNYSRFIPKGSNHNVNDKINIENALFPVNSKFFV